MLSMMMAVLQRTRWRGASFLFLFSRSGYPSTKDRMVRGNLKSFYPSSEPLPFWYFPGLTYHLSGLLPVQLYTSIFLLLFSWSIIWATDWVFKIDEVPSAISIFMKGAEARGSWVLECVWEVFVLIVWRLHTSLRESQMSLLCNGIIFLPLRRVFCVNLLACLATFKIEVKGNSMEQWKKIQGPHSYLWGQRKLLCAVGPFHYWEHRAARLSPGLIDFHSWCKKV